MPTVYLPGASRPPVARYTQDFQVGVYLVNAMETRYVHRTGQAAIPVAGPDGTAAKFVKTHAAFGGKVVRFAVERYGLMPLCPGVEKSDKNIVYIGGEVWVDAPAIAVDGYAYFYRVEGYYVYGFKKPVWVDTATGLPLGSTTIDRTIPSSNVLPAAAFVDPGTAWKTRAPGDNPTLFAVGSGTLQPAGATNPGRKVKLGQNFIHG